MKNQWYGDKRDIVKWGSLIILCQRDGVKRILQVAMLTRDPERAQLQCNGNSSEIPHAVWNHFRNARDVVRLGMSCDIEIEVFDEVFKHAGRDAYFEKVLARVNQLREPTLIFLDPDTGIEPSKLTMKHVSCLELSAVWKAMSAPSYLVVYQHGPRQLNWHSKYQAKFQSACGERTQVETFKSELAKDVVFFAAKKR